MNRSQPRFVFVLCLAPLLSMACNRGTDSPGGASNGAVEAAGEPSPEQLKDGELSTKLHEYIGCLNRESGWALRARSTYLGYFEPAKGPTGKEDGAWVPTVEANQCVRSLAKAKALPPALPELEAAAAVYGDALAKLDPLVKGAHDYYQHKDFKDDGWAKGKALHAPLVAAFDAFKQAHEAFDKKVTELNDGVSQRRIARLAKDPNARLEYLIAKSVEDAKKLADLMDVESLAGLDGAAYEGAFGAFEKSYQEMQAHATTHPDQAARVSSLSQFSNRANDLLKVSKELMRRKRDNKDFAKETGSPDSIEGHPSRVVKQFNEVIEASNDLEFRSP